jgi:hypothetical protein
MSGSDDSIEAMSERLGMNKGRLTSLIRLSYLAPEIVGALLAGGHPIWHRDRFPFCRGRPERERRLLSNASRPRCRRPNRNSNVRQGRLVNPFTMALWGLIVAASLAGGFLLVFAGLAVVVPVLAHSTWHLYRKVVELAGQG